MVKFAIVTLLYNYNDYNITNGGFMKKTRTTIMILFVVLFSLNAGFSAGDTYEAEVLKEYGLFSGTDKGFELERAPNRVEVAAMLVKFLGKEELAKEMKYSHPFTDVPTWANNSVGYLYHEGITTGVGNNNFGADQLASSKDFTVFLLRALGYDLTDFNYSETMTFAENIGLITKDEKTHLETHKFLRGDMVHLSYNALSTPMKNKVSTLKIYLEDKGVIKVSVEGNSDIKSSYQYLVPNKPNSEGEIDFSNDLINFEVSQIESVIADIKVTGADQLVETKPVHLIQMLIKGGAETLNQENLVVNVKMFKRDEVVYEFTRATTKYNSEFPDSLLVGQIIPILDFDHYEISLMPLSKYSTNTNVKVNFIKPNEMKQIPSAIKNGYALSIYREPNFYALSMKDDESRAVISKIATINLSKEAFLDPYRAFDKAVILPQYHGMINFADGEAFSSIDVPSLSTPNEEVYIIFPASTDFFKTVIGIYDINYNLVELFIVEE